MGKIDYPAGMLPDVEIIGGDTTPWKITLNKNNGDSYDADEVSGFRGILTITPFSMAQGLATEPIVIKQAIVGMSDDNEAVAMFSFSSSDTLELNGKYVYQIELNDGVQSRLGQGYLYVRRNNNPYRRGM